jgi:hypothetical protein
MGDLGPTELRLMQGLAQQVTATRPELVNRTVGELAWVFAKGFDALNQFWRRRLWFIHGRLAAWAWVYLPYRTARSPRPRSSGWTIQREPLSSSPLAHTGTSGDGGWAPGCSSTVCTWPEPPARTACWSPVLAHRRIRPPGTCTTASAFALTRDLPQIKAAR